jgi:deoxyguanosine kinase
LAQPFVRSSWYVIVEGAIGVGKTTLARMLRDRFNAGLQLEVFEENPFLADFYRSREQYAFQTQMFFLLSRYRQQRQVPRLLGQGALISDYMFAKDQLFAQLNLRGHEWEVYQQLHRALAEQIPAADLVVYLQADTDVLMARIAQRDRPYERNMDREYIEAVRREYERFFHTPQDVPVLIVDSNHLNFVTHPEDFQTIHDHVNRILQEGPFQPLLPQFETAPADEQVASRGRQIAEYQRFHVQLDKIKGFNTDVYFNYLCLSEEMGELGHELAQLWREQDAFITAGEDASKALHQALQKQRKTIEEELADCMAYLLKMANYAGIDLEAAYLKKMDLNTRREWKISG